MDVEIHQGGVNYDEWSVGQRSRGLILRQIEMSKRARGRITVVHEEGEIIFMEISCRGLQ